MSATDTFSHTKGGNYRVGIVFPKTEKLQSLRSLPYSALQAALQNQTSAFPDFLKSELMIIFIKYSDKLEIKCKFLSYCENK